MNLVISIVLGILLAACLFRLIFLKREIRKLNLALGAIVDTDTNSQLNVNSFDNDITVFAETINTLLERNRRDNNEKVRTETDLKRAITNISHDLRTPLTSASGYLQMLDSSELDEKTRTRYFMIIQERLDALSGLTNSLFEFARVIEGNVILDIQKINICNVIRDTLSANFAELERKGFSVDVDIPDTPVFYFCDADAIGRVLHNLVKNACVHGTTYLRIRFDDGALEIANKIEKDNDVDTERLFDRFYTSDASRSNKNTGLGLAIVKELMERMGGKITVHANEGMLVMRIVLPMSAK
jgi:signal transduction histidine kinase